MDLKSLLSEEIEREYDYLAEQEVGSEEYNASWKRLSNLQDKYVNLEKISLDTEAKNKQFELEQKKFEFEATNKRKLTELENEKFEFEATNKRKLTELENEKFKFETDVKSKQMEDDKKDRFIRNVMEGVKIGTGVIIPIIGLVWITAAEKEITFTGALRGYASLFVPKKIN